MGFITTTNRNGREVFACEIGAEGCNRTGCRARRCPWNYCQRYYVCASCWSKPDIKVKWTKKGHPDSCRVNHEEFVAREAKEKALLASGVYLRCSATTQEGETVHVLFRNQAQEYIGRYMSRDTYRAYPLGVPVTPEMFAEKGPVLPAPGDFIHNR